MSVAAGVREFVFEFPREQGKGMVLPRRDAGQVNSSSNYLVADQKEKEGFESPFLHTG